MYDFVSRQPETRSQRRHHARRVRGLSLIEVLMSVFVVSIGLLGIASLLPIAHHDAHEGTLDDLSSLVGKHAWRDMTIRGLNNPLHWYFRDGSFVYDPNGDDPNTPADERWQTTQQPSILVLDPRYVSRQKADPVTFPADGSLAHIPRITVDNDLDRSSRINPNDPGLVTDITAEDMFSSPDDLVFAEADQSESFPTQMYTFSNGSPPSRKRQSQGRFSWMTTLVPDSVNPELYHASIVVFYQRSLTETERVLIAEPLRLEQMREAGNSTQHLGISWAGVDLVLRADVESDLDISGGDWIALVKQNQTQLRWFRVTRTSKPEREDNEFKLEVSLEGPDTNLDVWFPSDRPQAFAVFIKNIRTVYEKTIRLDFSE